MTIQKNMPSSHYPEGNQGDCQVIETPAILQAKVGTGRGMNLKLLKQAEAAVDELKEEYEARLCEEVAGLAMHYEKMKKAGEYDLEHLYGLSHEMRCEGGTYDYPLISSFADTLCKFIEAQSTGLDDKGEKVVEAHIKALQAVSIGSIKGDGGEVGRSLVAGLDDMVARTVS